MGRSHSSFRLGAARETYIGLRQPLQARRRSPKNPEKWGAGAADAEAGRTNCSKWNNVTVEAATLRALEAEQLRSFVKTSGPVSRILFPPEADDDHSSRRVIAGALVRPTRRS